MLGTLAEQKPVNCEAKVSKEKKVPNITFKSKLCKLRGNLT